MRPSVLIFTAWVFAATLGAAIVVIQVFREITRSSRASVVRIGSYQGNLNDNRAMEGR
jgi:hypothetical protein